MEVFVAQNFLTGELRFFVSDHDCHTFVQSPDGEDFAPAGAYTLTQPKSTENI